MYAKDIDGHWHTIIDQGKGSTCGPACVRMVAKLAAGKDVGEEVVRRLIEVGEGNAVVATIASEAGGQAKEGSHGWGNQGAWGTGGGGSGTWNLAAALDGLGLKGSHVETGTPHDVFARTSLKRPGIAVVKWSDNSLHWVVVAGTVSNGKYLILDPAYGLGYVDPGAGELTYNPKASVTGTFEHHTVLLSA